MKNGNVKLLKCQGYQIVADHEERGRQILLSLSLYCPAPAVSRRDAETSDKSRWNALVSLHPDST